MLECIRVATPCWAGGRWRTDGVHYVGWGRAARMLEGHVDMHIFINKPIFLEVKQKAWLSPTL